MAPENTSATPTTKTKEQPNQRVSVSNERKAHPSSANARRMSSATKTDASNQPHSLQADHPTQNAAAQLKNDKAATKNRAKSKTCPEGTNNRYQDKLLPLPRIP